MPHLWANCLLYVVFPIWLCAGLADYLCHRRTRIEATSGFKESLLHLAQAVTLGVAILAGMFCRINLTVFALMAACLMAHFALSLWDTAYAMRYRRIGVLEQHVHGFLNVLPFMALALVAIGNWPRVRAPGDFSVTACVIPIGTAVSVLVLITVLDLLPLLEELWRTSRTTALHHETRHPLSP